MTNTYDNINRLHIEAVTAAVNVTTTYAYDSANNRTSKKVVSGGTGGGTVITNYSYNNLNQLTSYGDGTRGVSLHYDFNGNRINRIVSGGSDNGTDTYSYDFENRLIGLVKGTSEGAGTYAYTYDYRTRRITRDESSAGGNLTHIVFSGGTSETEYDGSNTTPTVENIRGSDYGGGVGGILYTLRGGTPSYTHENKRGDVVAKTDASGSLTYQAQYEAFGKQVATTGATLDRQKSNSKDTDPTGLVCEGFRYRDLDTGMFFTRDPAGFVDGPNLYTYVRQNPWTSFDPEGLQVPPGTNPYTSADVGPGMSYQQFYSMSQADQTAYMGGYRQGMKQAGPPLAVGAVATVATGGLAPDMFVAGALGRVAVAGFSGMVGGNSANMTHNAITGQPLSTNGPQALVVGGVTAAGGQAIGETAIALAGSLNKANAGGASLPSVSASTIQKINITLTDKNGAEIGYINGSYNPATKDLYVAMIEVTGPKRVGTSVDLYKAAIKQAGGDVKSITGVAGFDNAAALDKTGGDITQAPRTGALNKLGYTDHSYDAESGKMVAKKPDPDPPKQ